jgi:hypothetical protein
MLMIGRRASLAFLAMYFMAVIFGVLVAYAQPAQAASTGNSYTFVYQQDKAKQLSTDIGSPPPSSHQSDFTSFTTVYAQGPLWGSGSSPTLFSFSGDGKAAGACPPRGGGCSGITYAYQSQYSCPANNSTLTLEVDLQMSSNFSNDNLIRSDLYVMDYSSSSGDVKAPGSSNRITPYGLTNSQLSKIPQSCVPQAAIDTNNGKTFFVSNFNKLPASQQNQWPGVAAAMNDNSTPAGATDKKDCASQQGDFAWIMCPIFDKISSAFSSIAQGILTPLLEVNPLDAGSPLHSMWRGVLNFTEVLFVLIFLIAIFANVLSIGMSNYAIKKILPKLIAAAILVQFSYFICAIAIDIGNILGAGIAGLIGSVASHGTTQASGADTLIENIGILGLLGVAGALALIFWPLALPLFLMIAISIVALVVTLSLRYFILGVLVVLSPLAFAAMVLPNTESYFKKWYTYLTRLILMYPLVIALLAIAGNVKYIAPTATDSSGATFAGVSIPQALTAVLEVVVFVSCFLAIPWTFKWAGGAMAMGAARIDKLRGQGVKKVREGEMYKERKDRAKDKQLQRLDRADKRLQFLGGGPVGSRVRSGLMFGAAVASGRGGAGELGRNRDVQSLVNKQMKEMEDLGITNPQKLADIAAGKLDGLNDSERTYAKTVAGRAAAMKQLMKDGRQRQIESARAHMAGQPDPVTGAAHPSGKVDKQLDTIWGLSQGAGGKLYSQDPALIMGGAKGDKKLSADTIRGL